GAVMERLTLIDEGVSLKRDVRRLQSLVRATRAVLLVGDPIDSYVDEGFSEDRGQDVRPLLEAAAAIGQATGAAGLFARHPGKAPENVCPGSRQWRAVPKVVLQLQRDGDCPPRGVLSHYKDSIGTDGRPTRYSLEGKPGSPREWRFGEMLDGAGREVFRSRPIRRYKLQAACRLIRWIFEPEGHEPTPVKLKDDAAQQLLGEATVKEAMRLGGGVSAPTGQRGDPWLMVRTAGEWPAWLETPAPPQEVPRSPE